MQRPDSAKKDSARKGSGSSNSIKKHVQVVVRTRPMIKQELEQKQKSVVNCDCVTRTISMRTGGTGSGTQQSGGQLRNFGPFDRVYGPESTQLEIYNEVVAQLVKEVLNGYNCTVFAYGQTSSGKTYTMEGHHDTSGDYGWDSDPLAGITPRALHHIFSVLGDQKEQQDYYTVRVSYVEMYNEQIYDLLGSSATSQQQSLRIFDNKDGRGVSIVGMEEVAVRNHAEVYALLKRGAEKRRTASTLLNINSSRSHSVFTVTVTMREPGSVDGEELLRQGKINLVDLAGSENIGRSGATDKRAREAGNINVSLLSLGRVITALTTNAIHVPYRESKLTRILQDSLGGKTITTIIATLSPASTNLEESMSTLEYAQRAKNIKNNPEANQRITRRAILHQYTEEIERLRRDLVAAREKHGVYMDKENYDRMLENIDEKGLRVEELEGQLAAQLHQMQMFIEDLQAMDEHYNSVYAKYRAALDRLDTRRSEVEELSTELYATRGSLKAATQALALSNDAFLRLRAQADTLQENCAILSGDLEALHHRVERLKAAQNENDQLLGDFVAGRIGETSRAKKELADFAKESGSLMDGAMSGVANLVEGVTRRTMGLSEQFEVLRSSIGSYSSSVSQRVGEFEKTQTSSFAEFSTSYESQFAHLKSLHQQLAEKLTGTMHAVEAIEKGLQAHNKNIGKLIADSQTKSSLHSEKVTAILARMRKGLDELASEHGSATDFADSWRKGLGSLVEGMTTKLSKEMSTMQQLGANQQQLLKQAESGMEEQQTGQATFLADEQKRSIDVVGKLNEDTLSTTTSLVAMSERATTSVNELSNFAKGSAEQLNALAKQQKGMSADLTQGLTTSLEHSQAATERFVHQEFKRVQSTGGTPVRRVTDDFIEELEALDSPTEMMQRQMLGQTPRRASMFKRRESLLDDSISGSNLLSPTALKAVLKNPQQNREDYGQLKQVQLATMNEEQQSGKKKRQSEPNTMTP